jgi:hypothetical protein
VSAVMRRLLLCALLGGALLAAFPLGAHAAVYRASISGSQQVSWKVDGTRGNCEIRRGKGEGKSSFRFASAKAALVTAGRSRGGLAFVGSINSTAKGTLAGAFADTLETPCPGYEPGLAVTDPAGGCGATKFGLRVDLTAKGAFVYVTGPEVPLRTGSLAQSPGQCPSPVDGSFLDSTDFSACGDGRQQWKRSWGVDSSGGRGLLASRLALTPGQLPKAKHKRSFSKRTTIDCTMPSSYTGGVKIAGTLNYTLTLKRN